MPSSAEKTQVVQEKQVIAGASTTETEALSERYVDIWGGLQTYHFSVTSTCDIWDRRLIRYIIAKS